MAEELVAQGEGAPQEIPSGESASGGPAVQGSPEALGTEPGRDAAAASPPQAQPASLRDQLAGFGLDVSQFQDDNAALQAMAYGYRGYQSSKPYIEWSSRLLPYASEIEKWLADRQATKQQEAEAVKPWHKLPEFDPRWRQQIVRDPQSGELKAVGGAPPDLPHRFTQYAQARQDFEDRFVGDPIGTLKPGLEEFVKPLVQQAIQQSLQQYQATSYASAFVRDNSDWLHQRDAQGQTIVDPVSNRPVLSPYGARFAEHIRFLEGQGIRDIGVQQQMARERLELDLLRAQAAGQKVQQGVAQTNQAKVGNLIQQGAARVANRGGTATEAATGSQNAKLRLRDRLRQAFQEQGMTDADIVGPSVE